MRIEFLDFELDTDRFLLLRGGVRLPLRPKAFDLLIHLIEHRDRVVPRKELVQVVWGSAVVGPGSLSGLVNELRRALGERMASERDTACPAILRTVHARGYQFVAPVQPASGENVRRPARVGGADAGQPASKAVHPEVFARVRSRLDRVARGQGFGLRLQGPPGSGKTQLLEAAAEWAGRAGFEVLRLDPELDFSRDFPFAPEFAPEAAQEAAPEPESESPLADPSAAMDGPAAGSEAGVEWARIFAAQVCERLVGEERSCLTAVPDSSVSTGRIRFQQESRQLRQLAAILRARTEGKPQLLAIDSLRGGQAGERAMGWLSRLLAGLGDARFGVLVTSRHALHSGHRLGGRGRFEVIRLGAIEAAGLAELFEAAALPVLPRPLAEALIQYAAQPLAPVDSVGHWMRAHRAAAQQAAPSAGEAANDSEWEPASPMAKEDAPPPNRRARSVRSPVRSSLDHDKPRSSVANPRG